MKLEVVTDTSTKYLHEVCSNYYPQQENELIPLFKKLKGLHFIVQEKVNVGFINFKSTDSTIYIPMHFNRVFSIKEIKQYLCALQIILNEKEYEYITFIARNQEANIFRQMRDYCEFENAGISYMKDDGHTLIEIKPDQYKYQEGITNLDEVKRLFVHCFDYEKEYVIGRMGDLIDLYVEDYPNDYTVFCYDGKRIIGGLLSVEHSTYAYVYLLCTDPEYTCKGIGEKLMQQFFNRFVDKENVKLNVYSENKQAVRLYERLGFKPIKMTSLVCRGFNDLIYE